MRLLGNLLVFVSGVALFLIFAPVLKEEAKYEVNKITHFSYENKLTPPNTDFSIVIPKIAAVAPIVANVDSQDPKKYLVALRHGVAHSAGSSLPGHGGNIYLFAHSTDAFYNVGQYNAVFYLIGKLTNGDEIDIFYQGNIYKYEVYDKKVVNAKDAEFLGKISGMETLTLQTCYPPGTTLKRLIVLAEKKQKASN